MGATLVFLALMERSYRRFWDSLDDELEPAALSPPFG